MKKISTLLLSGTAALVMANGQTAHALCTPLAFVAANANTITCTGLISSGVNTGANTDTLTHNDGGLGLLSILPASTMGTGNDTFINNGGSSLDIDQGANDDQATVNGGAVGILTQGSGNDTFNSNGGLTTSVDQGGDNDTATISAGSVAVLNQGGGNDIFNSNGGLAGTVNQGDGNDDANITAGTIAIVLDQGNDDDDVIMSGGFLTSLIQGAGVDTLDLSAGTVALVAQGSGDDEATWSGGNLLIYSGGDGSDALTVTAASYTGLELLGGGDDLSSADGFTDTLTFQGLGPMTINDTTITNWERVGLSGSFLSFSNNALTVGSDAGDGLFLYGLSNLSANNGFALTGNLSISDGSGFGYTGAVSGTHAFSVSGNVVNNGALRVRNSTAGDVFTVEGDYAGTGDFSFDFDTDLNTSDLLVINGDVTGGTTILQGGYVGQGSYTGDGPGAGIAVVRVAGNTAPGDFMLYEEFIGLPLVVGAFAYELNLESDNVWYLQSTVRAGAVASLPAGGMSASLGNAFLGTYHERLGEQQRAPNSNVWGRVIGEFGNESVAAGGIGNIASSGATTGLQAGLDLVAHENSTGGRTRLGLYGGLGWMNHDASTPAAGGAAGTNEASGKIAGLYASHTSGGFYADAVLQGQWLDVDVAGGGTTIATDAKGWLASLEMGQDIALAGNASIEPQAQFIAGSNSMDSAIASDFTQTSWSGDDVMIGRLGARLKSANTLGNGAAVTGWLKANLWTDFKNDDQSVSVTSGGGTTTTTLKGKKAWVDLGIGFDVQASSNIALFVDGDVAVGLSGDYQSFGGKAGMKVDF